MLPTTIHFDERSPIYEQIVTYFCRALIKGDLQPGLRIPSIRELAMQLQVNTNTVQRAYQEMERRQLIFSKRGTGYFMTEGNNMVQEIKTEMVQDAIARFMEEMRALGFKDSEITGEIESYTKKEGA
ncbi:MAG: GntR family transcriptional regulator [Defluviitaleaceae bacterium]|nr:GntR family transcriptional regulator [Defluviitaleaceae bacterium]